jgi:hypothetical protein
LRIADQAGLQKLLLAAACVALWAFQMQRPITDDIAWLLDAGSRWFDGQRLYVDIMELNPPLIFYVMAVLTAGTWSKAAFLAGVCLAIFASAMWCGDRRWAAFAALTLPALVPFGQRDHLALIAALPFLVAEKRKWPMGVWLFAGTALKPHLLLIPLLGAAWRRQWRDPALWTLAGLVLAYAAYILAVHPAYVRVIVPLAVTTYHAYGAPFHFWPQLVLILVIAATNLRSPLIGPLVAALASYYLQGKFWYYQLIPAVGLAIYIGLVAPKLRLLNALCAAALAAATLPVLFQPKPLIDPIPAGARRVLFLTHRLQRPYPLVFERGIENTSPYPALWPVPGALDKPAILAEARRRQVDAIVARCPQYIFTDRTDAFDYYRFLLADPRFGGMDYRRLRSVGPFEVYASARCLRRQS